MNRRRSIAVTAAFAVAGAGLVTIVTARPAGADDVPQPLPFAQDWSNTGLITADDNWTAVPGIVGYQGGATPDLPTGTDPRTVLGGAPTAVDVFANLPAPTTAGGVAELELADPVVALQGSGTADAPNLVLTLSMVGAPADTVLSFVVRDVDGNADNATQQFNTQYRIGTTADWSNVDGGYLPDASIGGATQATPMSLAVPPAALGQPVVQFRFLTTNAPGSDEWLGIDDIEVGPADTGPAPPIATCPASLSLVAGDGGSTAVSATDADSAIVGIAITSAPVEGIGLTTTGPGQATLNVAQTTAPGTYPVTVTFTADDTATASCDVVVTVAAVTLISAVQGAGSASPLAGQPVIVDAVVTTLFTNQDLPDGFFVQEEDADRDADSATSEGVFVFCRGRCPTVVAGDLVRLRGTVTEFFEMTQVDIRNGGAEVRSSGNPRPTATTVDLPAAASTRAPATFEAVEGMVVTFPEPLTVSEHFELARYGQLRLTSDGRTYQFTHDNAPDPAGFAAHVAALAQRTIILDDDNNDQNDGISNGPDEPYPYPTGGLSTTNRMRAGDTITDLTGVLHYSFAGQGGTDAWRVRPLPGESYVFDAANPRPAAPTDVGGRIKVAAFNVLNYFTTIDTTSSNSTGPCGPSGTLDCRGADSAAELVRQRAKEVVAIGALDADVIGLVELQNDDDAAVNDLVAGLNARPGELPYAALATGFIGTDAIKVTFIYRPDRVRPTRPFDVLDSTDDPRFIDTRNRPALIQEFEEVATGERFTATVNHFKSKGSACADIGDPDLLDGQGNCAGTRTQAAAALADHLAELVAAGWDPDVLILGDLNAYRRETPITTLEAAGYVNLIDAGLGDGAYSFLFDGQLGYLDHALGTASAAAQVTGVTEWHVNADEVPLFDYNDTVRDAGEASFERESTVGGLDVLYAPDERRSSDHDPVVVGLELASLTIDQALIVQGPSDGGRLVASGSTGRPTAACPTLALRVGASTVPIGRTTRIGGTCVSITSRGLVTFDRTTGDFAAIVALPASFRLDGDEVTFVLTVDGTTFGVVREGRRTGAIWVAS